MSQISARRRKILALLAGGAVVGVGAAYTLANWNDSELLTGVFAAGSFNLEGSLDGTTYTDHAAADEAAALDAEQFVAETSNMVPGEVAYDAFFVRLDAATTVEGSLAQASIAATGDTDQYGYVVAAVDAAGACDASAIAAGTVIGQADSLSTNTSTATVALDPGADDAAGDVVQLCVEVTASDDLEQNATSTATWEFEAVSTDAS